MLRSSAATPKGRLFLLDVPFALRRTAQGAGARWDEEWHAWTWRGERLPKGLLPFCLPPYSLERLLKDRANRVRRAPSRPLKEIALRPHQEEAIALMRKIRRAGRAGALIGEAVGLGKTWVAWLSLRDDPAISSVLIACPLVVAPHWRATIQAAGDGGKEIAVVNYERLQKLFVLPDNGKKRTLRGKARDGEAMVFDAVVWDKAHQLRNPNSAREVRQEDRRQGLLAPLALGHRRREPAAALLPRPSASQGHGSAPVGDAGLRRLARRPGLRCDQGGLRTLDLERGSEVRGAHARPALWWALASWHSPPP